MIEAILIITLSSLNLIHIKKSSDFKNEIQKCIVKHIESYEDLCAEEASGYEEMKTWEAHRQGVICASESIKSCVNK